MNRRDFLKRITQVAIAVPVAALTHSMVTAEEVEGMLPEIDGELDYREVAIERGDTDVFRFGKTFSDSGYVRIAGSVAQYDPKRRAVGTLF